MSINLENMASEFNCSIDDIKNLLGGVASQIIVFTDMIESSIPSSDFETIKIASGMIMQEINGFDLSDIKSSVSDIISASNSEDIDSANSSFTSLKSAISDLNNI
ncbi:hypothetical protein MNB_SV-9-1216 [hydrothermal vent metagenome]|uniref:Uncharacterized protein n=1 Tax=hydrothermal vent metagenome TaxID=652676 RepID=A0A1W1BBB7_9ZZZZ